MSFITFAVMKPDEVLVQLKNGAKANLSRYKSQLAWLSIIRMLSFIGIPTSIYFLSENTLVVALVVLVFLICFIVSLRKYADLKDLNFHEKIFIGFIDQELEALKGNWKTFDEGEEFINRDHRFTSDLNVFGKHSIYQFLNRARSSAGRMKVAKFLDTELLNLEEIESNSSMIQAFSKNPEFLFRFLAFAGKTGASDNLYVQIQKWQAKREWKRSHVQWTILRFVFPFISIGSFLVYLGDLISLNAFLLCLVIPMGALSLNLKSHMKGFNALSDILKTVDSFKGAIELVQSENFDDPSVKALFKNYNLEKSSEGLEDLSRIMGAIDSRNNVFVSVILNLFLLWDFQCAYRVVNWKAEYGDKLLQWLELVSLMESYCSMSIYVFANPNFKNADLIDGDDFTGKQMKHVLMDGSAVANDFILGADNKLSILTGANMAGKSTYLRTIGTSMLLAMRGLPVNADELRFKPQKIFTSMLTVDSLGASESYFFSELKRLRVLVDYLESGEQHFVILDEILKGTNSKDKAEGSKGFVKKLIQLPMKGLVATHDLSLCELSNEYPAQIINQKFEIGYSEDNLVFSYKVEPGVCENMNASFLLQKMDLTV